MLENYTSDLTLNGKHSPFSALFSIGKKSCYNHVITCETPSYLIITGFMLLLAANAGELNASLFK